MNLEPAPKSPEPVDAEISALVQRLNSRKPEEVRAAGAQLIERGDAGVEALLTALEAQKKRDLLFVSVSLLVFLALIPLLIMVITPNNNYRGYGSLASMTLFTLLLWLCVYRIEQRRQLLVGLDDVRVVGFLTESMHSLNEKYRAAVRDALTRLLPRVRQSDAKYLTVFRRKLLLQQFDLPRRPTSFLLAILKAMEQVGGAEAIPVVSRLARGEGRAAKDSALKAAAQECLPYLEARAEGRELRDTLLRSSSAAEVAPETLLRPAPATSEEPANELLRPRE